MAFTRKPYSLLTLCNENRNICQPLPSRQQRQQQQQQLLLLLLLPQRQLFRRAARPAPEVALYNT